MYSNQTIYRSQHKLESRVGQICKHINLIKTHIYFKQNRWSQRYPVETDFTIHLHCLYLNGVLITSTDLSCTGFIWVGKLHWLDMFLLYSVTGWNIACSGTTVTCYLLSFAIIVVYPVHFLLTANIKRGNQGIILLIIQNQSFYFDELMRLSWRVNTIVMECLKI